MSRRYGRNQKRAARERQRVLEENLASLQRTLDAEKELHRRTRSHLHDAEEEIAGAKEILGHNFFAFNPTEINAQGCDPKRFYMTQERWSLVGSMSSPIHHSMEIRNIRLDVLAVEVAEYMTPSDFGKVHCTANFGDGYARYAATRNEIKSTPVKILARRIGNSIGAFLANELKKHGGRD